MAFDGIPWKEIEKFLDVAIGQAVESVLSGQAEQEAEMRARVDGEPVEGKRVYAELLRKLFGIDDREAAEVTAQVQEDLRGSALDA